MRLAWHQERLIESNQTNLVVVEPYTRRPTRLSDCIIVHRLVPSRIPPITPRIEH